MNMEKRREQKLIFGAITALILGLLLAWAFNRGLFESWQLRASNFLYWQEEKRTLDDIVIVAIDNRALELRQASEIGTLRFAKSQYARLISRIEDAGAAAVGLDVILSEESSEQDKEALIQVLKKYPDIVLAAEPVTPDAKGLKPLPEFIEANGGRLGSVLFIPDRDNTVRRQPVRFVDEQSPNSFAVQLVHSYLGQPQDVDLMSAGHYVISKDTIRVGSKKVPPIVAPLDENGNLLINFFGAPGSYQTISMADAIDGRFVDNQTGEEIDLANKVVLIGEVGTALHDVQTVPVSFGKAMPGVEIHANAIQTLLTQQFLEEQSRASAMIVIWFLLTCGLAASLWLRIRWSLAVVVSLIVAYTMLTWVLFEIGYICNLVYPYFALILSFIAAYLYRYFYQERLARQTQSAFKQYVSPDVVRSILDNPNQLELGGNKRNMTVFFSDIAGFTSISEKLEPEELVEQLNEYLDEMSEVILQLDGTIDKYIGDAVMAFWNAPLDQPDHAIRACRAALNYQKKLKELNQKREKRGEVEFAARVGLNTGDMIVGNMGSTKRFDYTVIGDSVNLGARLEGVNKMYGTFIMLSEYTHALAKDEIEVREVDLITVKGKNEPVRIFELLSMKGELNDKKKKIKHAFEKGLKFYRQQRWQQAKESFRQVLNIDEKDGPARVFLERCDQLQKEELPQDWDGVFKLQTK